MRRSGNPGPIDWELLRERADRGLKIPRPERIPPIIVEPFPSWVLPKPVADYIDDASRALSCPPDYLGVPALGVLGTAIGNQRRVEVKVGWVETCLLYVATIGDPGSVKSPAFRKALEPLERIQKRHREKYIAAWQQYKKQLRDFRSEQAAWNRTKPPKGPPPTEPTKPPAHQILSTDSTIEALGPVLEQNPRGIAYAQDELAAWVRRFNEYRHGVGADRQVWSSNWSGAPWVINRKMEPTLIEIHDPFVAVIGCLPPELLGDLSDEQGREDGFIHRIAFSYPEAIPHKWIDAGIDPELREEYCTLVEQLTKLPIPIVPGDGGRILQLTADAREQFVVWVERHFEELEQGPPHLRGPWSKLTNYFARLALIVHLARVVCGETDSRNVDEISVLAAMVLTDYFKSHARKVYRELHTDPLDKSLSRAVEWIKKRPGKEASVRDFVTNNVASCRRNNDALTLFSLLQQAGWGLVEERQSPNGGRSKTIFILDCRAIAGRLQGRA